MTNRPNPDGILARLRRQAEAEAAQPDDEEHQEHDRDELSDLDDHELLDDPAVHRPELVVLPTSS